MVASQPFVIYYTSLEYPLITKDFSIPLMQYLCAWNSKTGFVGAKVAVSRCRQEVWDEPGRRWNEIFELYRTIAWKSQSPLVGIVFSHRHLDRRLRSAEFLAVLFHAVCSDEFERPA